MTRNANLYEICDQPILGGECHTPPGFNLRFVYQKLAGHPVLKYLILEHCRHPAIKLTEISPYQEMMRKAMQASADNWQDPLWIEATFGCLARLLDSIENPHWQQREKAEQIDGELTQTDLQNMIDNCLQDILRIWDKDKNDPWFPVAAQVELSGDDHMDGRNFINVLQGLGSFEYKNITVLFALIRCFLMTNPARLRLIRKPYRGISEPMDASFAWIWHRIAFSDVNFFEHLLVFLVSDTSRRQHYPRIVPILENLLRYCVCSSQEWLETPNKHIQHPAITCLPKDPEGRPLCRLSEASWQKKRDLGFGEYVPDTDTTFLTLAMARKWLDFVQREQLTVDKELLAACNSLLAYPWVEIISEYQVGGKYNSNPPTIQITRPLDYMGAVPIWFDKTFRNDDGRIIREMLGNEICPGHNMDILDAILVNRKQWLALEGENLAFLQRLLDFHHRAFASGNFRHETAHKYYLPETYVYYLGRMYQTYGTLTDVDKRILDPEGKIEDMRWIAQQYCKDELIGYSLNAFDAALAVSALVLLAYEPKHDGVIAAGLKVLSQAAGEGRGRHPYRAYEWNRMRHPTRILVGSEVATSLFVLRACSEAMRYLKKDITINRGDVTESDLQALWNFSL
ncbi:hypothetical protein SAMN05216386_0150 [Nitrosospira briensis]|uniref:Uncharacterized protein n=1 Tax=Nitrosospira briensis TaxID=35799 RepID=A0A1I4XIJ1_9PROT|nr:hypothetical protein [Nitrosospira briensis]SFN25625.1 hypothetical protein SAMN05216386_0150 [Nitrosospira briensis]